MNIKTRKEELEREIEKNEIWLKNNPSDRDYQIICCDIGHLKSEIDGILECEKMIKEAIDEEISLNNIFKEGNIGYEIAQEVIKRFIKLKQTLGVEE